MLPVVLYEKTIIQGLKPSRTAVPLWGQSTQIISTLSPKRDCGSKRVKIRGLLYSFV